MYFVGVSTGGSFMNALFPLWARALELGSARLEGIDVRLDAPAGDYVAVVEFIRGNAYARGALVTSHKVNLVRHAGPLFDELEDDALRLGEVSAIIKRQGRLVGAAMDPVSAGAALGELVPAGHWRRRGDAEVLILGCGGAALAIALRLLERPEGDRPTRITLTDIGADALEHARERLGGIAPAGRLRLVHVAAVGDHHRLLAGLGPGSLVVNATGMGKDRPGSPVGDDATFPNHGLVWELNYRGQRRFLAQARRQQEARALTIADGWLYFLHGWSQVIGAVFGVSVDAVSFARLRAAAESLR